MVWHEVVVWGGVRHGVAAWGGGMVVCGTGWWAALWWHGVVGGCGMGKCVAWRWHGASPAPCALRPAPCALRPAPCALRPASCTLRPHLRLLEGLREVAMRLPIVTRLLRQPAQLKEGVLLAAMVMQRVRQLQLTLGASFGRLAVRRAHQHAQMAAS